ncbi:MAG: alpha-xylosidase [Lachnospiraceae bacterium]|nr:alpha-xylosidase [Lachnospiraceae bacterium]
MKISNGCWIQKEGITAFFPQEVYFCDVKEDMVKLVAPTHHIKQRGDTLGGVNITLEITTPVEGVIRVKAYHYKGAICDAPAFELSLPEKSAINATETEDSVIIKSGALELFIDKKNWRMEYRRNGKVLSVSAAKDMAYVSEEYFGDAYVRSTDEDVYMRQQLSIAVDELFYGFGEKFSPFVKNGQTVDIWNEDGGTSTELSYKNIPFYISSQGYGVFVNHTDKVSFEVGSESVEKVSFTVPGESLDYFFIDGPDPKEVVKRYTDLTGKPALPPAWTFGLWLSTSFTTDYDEKTVMHFIDGMLKRGIPLKVFHFDCFWMKDFHWTDLVWDERVFPDPAGMISRIHEKGLKCCVWINPYIAQESILFDEGMEKGYFLKRPDGGVWQWDMWQPGMAIVDFSNPDATKWFQEKLEALVDMGVDAFKTDFGERIPTDCVYANGLHPRKMHNYYTYLYNQAVFEVLEKKKGKNEAVLFARSATVGGQKFPVHWGGDCWSNYSGMEETMRGGLSLQMSGFGFWSHDMGGFEQTSTADVYKRWVAFGLLSSHSRLHGSSSYRVPWNYDDEAVDVVRVFTRLKMRLMPYLWAMAQKTHKEGIPMMRAMVMEYPKDRMCRYLDKQYFLGDSLLAAPICNPESKGVYYLPEGTWTDFFTGEKVEGGKWFEKHYSYLEMPLFVKENTILPISDNEETPEYDYADQVTFNIYALKSSAEAVVYDMEGVEGSFIRAERKGNEIEISLNHTKPCWIKLIGEQVASVEGAEHTVQNNNTLLIPKAEKIKVTLG